MKQIFLSLLILSAIIYPPLILTSCTEEEMNSGSETVNEMSVTEEETDSEIVELERHAGCQPGNAPRPPIHCQAV